MVRTGGPEPHDPRGPQHLGLALIPFRHARMEPLVRLERTASALRGRRSGQVSYTDMAPGAGVEPTSPGSGPGILPLNDPG